MKSPTSISLEWTGDLVFRVDATGGRLIVTDGNGKAGVSPVELLAAAAASCMAVDVVHILTRSRLEVDACRVRFTGERAETEPHRLTRVHMAFELEGTIPQAQLDRALQLSRDKVLFGVELAARGYPARCDHQHCHAAILAGASAVPDPVPATGSRLDWLDWFRGIAVVVMIEAHTVDAWTQNADRHTLEFGRALIVGGMGAPLFLFLAGVAAALAAESRVRRGGDVVAAARSVRRRGWEIFGLAFLFRLQSYLLNPGSRIDGLLKVDILNVMGPSIVLVAWLWQFGRTRAGRIGLLTVATTAIAMVTPLVRTSTALAALPDFVEAYIRPLPGLTNFAFFPWSGFVPAGAVAGLVVSAACRTGRLGLAAIGFAVAGVALAVAGYAFSFQPTLYPESRFWTTSPTFFLLRAGF